MRRRMKGVGCEEGAGMFHFKYEGFFFFFIVSNLMLDFILINYFTFKD